MGHEILRTLVSLYLMGGMFDCLEIWEQAAGMEDLEEEEEDVDEEDEEVARRQISEIIQLARVTTCSARKRRKLVFLVIF